MTGRHYPRSGLRPAGPPPPPAAPLVLADLASACRLACKLSPAEEVVMTLVAQGLTVDRIAGMLWKSPETVRTQKKSALRKMGARNGAHGTALWVLRHMKQAA